MTVQVGAARIPDRDRLLRELLDVGLAARPRGELGIDVSTGGAPDVSDRLFAEAEALIVSIGAPFVPIRHRGVIYIRPPLS